MNIQRRNILLGSVIARLNELKATIVEGPVMRTRTWSRSRSCIHDASKPGLAPECLSLHEP